MNGEYDLDEEMNIRYGRSNGSLIIENLNMKVFNFFCAKLQKFGFHNKTANSILIIGREEVGKSSYLKNYFNEINENMYIRVKSHDHKVMDKLIRELTEFKYKRPRASRFPTNET